MTGQPARTLELREHGTLTAFGGELTIPFGTRFGLRGEGVYKRQQLAEADVTLPDAPAAVLGTATLDGHLRLRRAVAVVGRRRPHAAGAGPAAAARASTGATGAPSRTA